MFNWAYVENSTIKEYHTVLPENWKNYSGLNLSEGDLNYLVSIGWYKILKADVNYNTDDYRLKNYNYAFINNQVVETLELDTITSEEKQAKLDDAFNIFIENLRLERNRLLQATDWTELPSARNNHSVEWASNYDNYRQQLRDLPSQYTSISEIDWPMEPL